MEKDTCLRRVCSEDELTESIDKLRQSKLFSNYDQQQKEFYDKLLTTMKTKKEKEEENK